MVEISRGADIELEVEAPSINGFLYDPTTGSWDLEIWTSSYEKMKITKKENGDIVNIGGIYANAIPKKDGIKLCIKSSENPFTEGTLKSQMTIYLKNIDFKNGIQVLKTPKCETDIRIV